MLKPCTSTSPSCTSDGDDDQDGARTTAGSTTWTDGQVDADKEGSSGAVREGGGGGGYRRRHPRRLAIQPGSGDPFPVDRCPIPAPGPGLSAWAGSNCGNLESSHKQLSLFQRGNHSRLWAPDRNTLSRCWLNVHSLRWSPRFDHLCMSDMGWVYSLQWITYDRIVFLERYTNMSL